MTVRLNPHSERLLRERMARGYFRTPEEVLELALETLAQQESALSPFEPSSNGATKSPDEAVRDILDLRKGVTLGGLKIKDLIHEGHDI